MGISEMLVLSVALGVDTLSVSLGIGLGGLRPGRMVQMSLAFAGASALAISSGYILSGWLHVLMHYIARLSRDSRWETVSPESLLAIIHFALSLLGAAILAAIGVQLLLAERDKGTGDQPIVVHGLWGLVGLACLVSFDAVSAGLSLGMLTQVSPSHLAFAVGGVNGSLSLLGLGLGQRLHTAVRHGLRPLGALLLFIIAGKIIWELLF